MTKINVEDRKKAVFDLNGIAPFDEKMTFYYDESGNCRKFSLTESGFNSYDALKGDFVLAGVAHEGNRIEVDVDKLHAILGYQQNQKELKFKHLYHNAKDFLSFIGSKRALAFLNWLDGSGLYIHYSTMNNLFYSLVDIVDSLWETHPQCAIYMWDFKSALYDFVIQHQAEVVSIFVKHTYPDVKDVSSFCSELCELIKTYNNEDDYYPGFFLELFRQMLKTAGRLNKMIFIQENEPLVLIDGYYGLYLARCMEFSESYHIFDEEQTVIEKFKEVQLIENGVPINNWRFVKSHEEILIQVSDLLAGLLRKLFMFLDSNNDIQIQRLSESLTMDQRKGFALLYELLSKSNSKSVMLLKNTNTLKNIDERTNKLKILGDCQ
ncbi:MAG: DUF3800 domain-containing protein [Ruminococcus sp.]|nr:DUF3800 domain-containing protein [Ruminococcus sp.]